MECVFIAFIAHFGTTQIFDANITIVKYPRNVMFPDTAADTRLVKICCTFWLFFYQILLDPPESVEKSVESFNRLGINLVPEYLSI